MEQRYSEVYYAVPAFYTERFFNDAYTKRKVVEFTMFVRPSAIGPLVDDDVHYVAFKRGATRALFYSAEGRELAEGVLTAPQLMSHLTELAEQRVSAVDWAQIAGMMFDAIEGTAFGKEKKAIAKLKEHLAEQDGSQQVAFLARAYFDAEPIAIGDGGARSDFP